MKKEQIPELKRKAYRLIPISQVALYKKLKLSSQDGAKLVSLLLNEKLLKRKATLVNSRKTYMLMRGNMDDAIKKDIKQFKSLIQNGMFSPCTGCPEPTCNPVVCDGLNAWIK